MTSDLTPTPCATLNGSRTHLREGRRDRLTMCGYVVVRNLVREPVTLKFCRACQRCAAMKYGR